MSNLNKKNKVELIETIRQLQKENEKLQLNLEICHKKRDEVQAMLHKTKSQVEEIDNLNNKINLLADTNKRLENNLETLNKQYTASPEISDGEQLQEHAESKIEIDKNNKETPNLHNQTTSTVQGHEPKASFRIDLYPHKNNITGKIEHLLSKDKEVIEGVDDKHISAFLKKHIPLAEEFEEDTKNRTESEEVKSKRQAIRSSHQITNMIELQVLINGSKEEIYAIQHDQKFTIQLVPNETTNTEISKEPILFDTLIYAKPMLGGSQRLVGSVHKHTTYIDKTELEILPNSLTKGMYSLTPTGSFRTSGKEQFLNFNPGRVVLNIF